MAGSRGTKLRIFLPLPSRERDLNDKKASMHSPVYPLKEKRNSCKNPWRCSSDGERGGKSGRFGGGGRPQEGRKLLGRKLKKYIRHKTMNRIGWGLLEKLDPCTRAAHFLNLGREPLTEVPKGKKGQKTAETGGVREEWSKIHLSAGRQMPDPPGGVYNRQIKSAHEKARASTQGGQEQRAREEGMTKIVEKK